ncbi:MAG: hypothetical protein WCO86_16305 [Planctomycetota bacterium]
MTEYLFDHARDQWCPGIAGEYTPGVDDEHEHEHRVAEHEEMPAQRDYRCHAHGTILGLASGMSQLAGTSPLLCVRQSRRTRKSILRNRIVPVG